MIISALLALALADPAAGAPPSQSKSEAKSEAFKDPNRIICRREETVGTHRPQKICMTKHEWDLTEEQSRGVLRNGGIQAIEKPFDPNSANPTGGLVGGASGGPH